MDVKKHILKIFCTWLLLWTGGTLYAQFSQLPVDHSSFTKSHTNKSGFRTQAQPTTLPFWDDFSSSQLDSLLWESQGTSISHSIGNNAPSLGVVLLDGVDQRGKPYSNTNNTQGVGDQLTSAPIHLDTLSEEEKSSIYLSFFWQAGGKAEMHW